MTGKLRIAPIGTCRIHRPLRVGLNQNAVALEFGRNYGFVHTAAEALQQLRFMSGSAAIPAEIRRLAFRPNVPANFDDRTHRAADLYMVEISSRRLITVDDLPIQINYLQRHFSDFFADRTRARWFWQMAKPEHLAERSTLLHADRAFLRLDATDQALLCAMVSRRQDDAEIEREIVEIAGHVGPERVMFVTHVDALTPDNTLLDQRHRLIHLVRAVCRKHDLPSYDPTPLMREFGQMKAMENDGLDLTHYTGGFAAALFEAWNARFFAPRTRPVAEDFPPDPAEPIDDSIATLEKLWAEGQIAAASQRLRQMLRADPALSEHRRLLGSMAFELGDYEGAIQALEMARRATGSDEQADIILMRAYFQLDDFAAARSYAVALLSDEKETAEIVRVCAVSAAKLGDLDAAIIDWKRHFRIAEEKSEAADAVLELLLEEEDRSIPADWAIEVLTSLSQHLPSFLFLWHHYVVAGDRVGLLTLAKQPIELPASERLALADRAAAAGMAMPAAVLVSIRGVLKSEDEVIAAWVSRRAAEWLAEGQALLEADDLGAAADRIQACWHVGRSSNVLIRARRAIEQKMRKEARARFLAGDHEGVIALIESAQIAQIDFPEMNGFLGRSADALGDSTRALRYLTLAADEDGSPITALVLLGRVAARGGHYPEAIEAYRRVLARAPQEAWAAEEATKQLGPLALKATRLARQHVAEGNFDGAWALLRLVLEVDPEHVLARKLHQRIMAGYRARLRALDAESNGERLAVGQAILRIFPDDAAGLRAAAIGAMRLHRFPLALDYWQRLLPLAENKAQIALNIQKCELWIERASRKDGKRDGVARSAQPSNSRDERKAPALPGAVAA